MISGFCGFLGMKQQKLLLAVLITAVSLPHSCAEEIYRFVKWNWTLYIIGCQDRVLPPAAVWCFPSVASLSLERPTDLAAAARWCPNSQNVFPLTVLRCVIAVILSACHKWCHVRGNFCHVHFSFLCLLKNVKCCTKLNKLWKFKINILLPNMKPPDVKTMYLQPTDKPSAQSNIAVVGVKIIHQCQSVWCVLRES